ncbi:mechanosensitive ion channel family protein [Bradyrhizobium retamae]|uniref:mechanosensitive ion channel family protein n=1 Tax=Bradyrhizobium retamae TaxID=1300035 RepID=UPI0007C78D07|nr:mechanosensitive ion channel domain-containing protein [Bradyrhizobium retamae]
MQDWISSAVTAINPMPVWIIVVATLLVAVVAGLLFHHLLFLTIDKWLRNTENYIWLLVLEKLRAPSAFAAVIFFTTLLLQLTPIGSALAALLARVLQIALIALLTWMAIVITEIFGSVYLRRLQVDVEDNLLARKHATQVRILKRAAVTVIAVIGTGFLLMSFDAVRQYGVSLFASAGVAGLAVGLAARPLLSNLIAGVQIAMTQPIRIRDVIIVEGEYGTVEEITSTYVVVQLWDWRRLVLPLSYFIEKPFQNWTRETSSIIGAVTFNVDYSTDVAAIRSKLNEIVAANPRWDRRIVNLQVTDATADTIQLRALVSAATSAAAWDLRCEVREDLIEFVKTKMPECLPRRRQQLVDREAAPTLPPADNVEARQPEKAGLVGGRSRSQVAGERIPRSASKGKSQHGVSPPRSTR